MRINDLAWKVVRKRDVVVDQNFEMYAGDAGIGKQHQQRRFALAAFQDLRA